jgi:hypothetical protein
VFNYGFADGWELVIDIDGFAWTQDTPRSYVQSEVFVKHVLREGCLQEKHGPSVALETGPLLPTIPRKPIAIGSPVHDEVGWSADLIVSECLGPVTMHANFTVEYQRDRSVAGSVGSIFEGPRDWRVRPVGEIYIEDQSGSSATSILVGAIWTYRKSLTFDAAVRTLQGSPTSNELRVGLTWVFGV